MCHGRFQGEVTDFDDDTARSYKATSRGLISHNMNDDLNSITMWFERIGLV